MKAVILAGGLGTRISEESHLRPKPMIEIGGRPNLAHHEICSRLRLQRLHHLPRLPRLHDQGVLRQLRAPQRRRHRRPGEGRDRVPRHQPRAVAGHPGRDRRRHHDRRAAEAGRPATSTRASPSSSPMATASPTWTCGRCAPSTKPRPRGDGDGGVAARPLRRAGRSTTGTGASASSRSRRATTA